MKQSLKTIQTANQERLQRQQAAQGQLAHFRVMRVDCASQQCFHVVKRLNLAVA